MFRIFSTIFALLITLCHNAQAKPSIDPRELAPLDHAEESITSSARTTQESTSDTSTISPTQPTTHTTEIMTDPDALDLHLSLGTSDPMDVLRGPTTSQTPQDEKEQNKGGKDQMVSAFGAEGAGEATLGFQNQNATQKNKQSPLKKSYLNPILPGGAPAQEKVSFVESQDTQDTSKPELEEVSDTDPDELPEDDEELETDKK